MENLTKIQEKIKKESMWGFGILLIAALGATGFAVFGVFMAIMGFIGIDNFSKPFEEYQSNFLATSFGFIFNGCGSAIISFVGVKIFRDIMNSHTPFNQKTVACLNWISVAFMGMVVANSLLNLLVSSILLVNTRVELFTFAFPYLVAAIIFGSLSRIFEYGRLLQQESDETL